MSETGQRIELQVQSNAQQAIAALGRLTDSLERLKSAATGGMNLGNVASQIKNLSQTLNRVDIPEEHIQRLERLANSLERLRAIGPVEIRLSNGARRYIEQVQDANNARDTRQADAPIQHDTMEGTGRMASLIGRLRDIAASAAPAMHALGRGISIAGAFAIGAVRGIGRLAGTVLSLGGALMKVSWKGIKGIASGVGKAISAFKELTSKINISHTALGKLSRAFKRIAFYRLIRAAIKEVTDGVKTGIDNLYQWSAAMNGSFAQSMDRGASASLMFKNSIGAMLGPAIEAVIPLLIQLANVAIQAANAINQFISVLFGRSTWTRAKPVETAAQSLGGAGKAAKKADDEIKGLLADWDELNIIANETNKDPSGGGGGGAGGISATDMFEQVPLEDNWWTDLAQQLKDAISAGDWEGAGRILASKLNEVVATLDTDGWAAKLRGVLEKGLRFAFGFLDKFDFKGLGVKVGAFFVRLFGSDSQGMWKLAGTVLRLRFMALVKFAAGVFENKELFTGLGTSLATMLNNVFDFTEEDINTAAEAIGGVVSGAAASAINFFDQTDFENIGKQVNDFLLRVFGNNGTINGTAIGKSIRLALVSAFDVVRGFLGNENENVFAAIAETVANTINSFFDFDESEIETIKGTINSGIGKAMSGIITFLDGVKWEEIGAKVSDLLAGIDWETHFKQAWEIIKRIIKAVFVVSEGFLSGLFDGFGLKLYNAIAGEVNKFMSSIANFFGLDDVEIAPKFGSTGAFDEWFNSGHTGALREFNGLYYLRDEYLALIEEQKEFNAQLEEGVVTHEEAAEALKKGLISQDDYDLLPQNKKADDSSGLYQVIQAWNNLGYIDIKQWSELSEAIHDGRVKSVEELQAWAADLGAEFEKVLEQPTSDIDPDEAARILGLDEDVLSEGMEGAVQQAAEAVSPVTSAVENVVQVNTVLEAPDTASETVEYELDGADGEPTQVKMQLEPIAEVDSTALQGLYDQLYQELNDYDPLDTWSMAPTEFWNSIIQPIVDEAASASGLTETATDEVSAGFYEKWMESLYDEDWEGSTTGLLNILQEAIESAVPDALPAIDTSALDSSLAASADNAEYQAQRIINALSAISGISLGGGGSGSGIDPVHFVRGFAAGGYPTTGQMFIAREAGPEYVGTMSGHTAVANNEQIVAGISSGVASANAEQNALLRQQNQLLTQLLNKKFTAEAVPSSGWGRFIQQSNEAYERQTGRG